MIHWLESEADLKAADHPAAYRERGLREPCDTGSQWSQSSSSQPSQALSSQNSLISEWPSTQSSQYSYYTSDDFNELSPQLSHTQNSQ